MKNVWIYLLFLLIGGKSLGQGVDVIFLLDNSLDVAGYPVNTVPPGSEYEEMHHSVNALMDYILECSTYNRVTTVQHSDGYKWGNLVAVDSDFDNDTIAFTRDFDNAADKLEESLDFVSDRLLGIPDPPPYYGTGLLLNKAPGNKLVVVIFNEYSRTGQLRTDGSVPPFASFDDFKALHDATIMYIHINGSITNIKSAAAIASLGGNYTGQVESYTADPYGPGATPRYYWNTNDYALSAVRLKSLDRKYVMHGYRHAKHH